MYEEYENGKPLNKSTPFWRVIDVRSTTAKKLTFGTNFIKQQRIAMVDLQGAMITSNFVA